jgi:hypothetical protein
LRERNHLEGIEKSQFYGLPAHLAERRERLFSVLHSGKFSLEPVTDEVADDDRGMGEVGELLIVGIKNSNHLIIEP